MNCLFIDTASGTRVLIEANGKVYYRENNVNAGSEILMPMIDEILREAGLTVKDIDIFGACVGPGSFTGLRIGLTTIKTFCYALSKPCFAVNNLRLLSYNSNTEEVIAVSDAGNKVCYIARFSGEKEVEKTKCVTADDALKYIAAHPECKVSTDNKLHEMFGGVAGVGKDEMLRALKAHIGNAIDYTELTPLYVRKAQPERGEGDL